MGACVVKSSIMAKPSFVETAVVPTKKPVHAGFKLTPSKKARIVELFRQGNYASTVANVVGISAHTLHRWMQLGEIHTAECEYFDPLECEEKCNQTDAALRALFTEVKMAESEAESNAVSKITSDPSWIASMTFLERRHRERWARPSDKVHQPTTPVQVQGLQIDISQKKIAAEGLQKEIALEEKDGIFQIPNENAEGN